MQVRNNINLIGNLGEDPDVKVFDSGNKVVTLSLATNEYYRDKNGDRQTRTDWHRVKAFGKLADLFEQYLQRGSQLAVSGSLRYNRWIDKHDQVRNTAEVHAHSFTFLSPGKNGGSPLGTGSESAGYEEEMATETVSRPPAPAPAKRPAAPAPSERSGKQQRSAKNRSAVKSEDLPF